MAGYIHVVVFAEVAQILVVLFDTLLMALDPLPLQSLVHLLIVSPQLHKIKQEREREPHPLSLPFLKPSFRLRLPSIISPLLNTIVVVASLLPRSLLFLALASVRLVFFCGRRNSALAVRILRFRLGERLIARLLFLLLYTAVFGALEP